jgi:hypothetical protein
MSESEDDEEAEHMHANAHEMDKEPEVDLQPIIDANDFEWDIDLDYEEALTT